MYDNFVDNLIEAHGKLQNRYQRLHAVAEHRRRLLIDEQQELEIAETVAYGLHEKAQRLRADLARVTEELDEERTRIKKVLEIAHNLRAERDESRQDHDDYMTVISRAIGPNAGQFMDGPWSDMDDVVRNMRTGIDKISADNARLREAVRHAVQVLKKNHWEVHPAFLAQVIAAAEAAIKEEK